MRGRGGRQGRIVTLLLLVSLGRLPLDPFPNSHGRAFGEQSEKFLKRTGAERFLGPILAGLMLVAAVLFLL
ncbi:MAG: hypothetical protein ACYCZU_07445 [Devosia sp.]